MRTYLQSGWPNSYELLDLADVVEALDFFSERRFNSDCWTFGLGWYDREIPLKTGFSKLPASKFWGIR